MLSVPAYVRNYRREYRPSKPGKLHLLRVSSLWGLTALLMIVIGTEEEWDDRNLLYSIRFDLATAILIPCNQRQM